MKKITLLILQILLYDICLAQAYGVMPRVLSKPKSDNSNIRKVVDSWQSCDWESGCNSLYPVLNENFDYPSDLLNKWKFDLGYTQDDDVAGNGHYSTWMGDATSYNTTTAVPLNSNNFQFNNGVMTLSLKQNPVTRNGKNYPFTSGMINSLSHFRTGIFEARIKVPGANKMFPAYWLLSSKGNYAEIDIFEYFDNDVAHDNCSTYDLHRMSLHNGHDGGSNEYHRSDKYPQDVNEWHTYKLVWSDLKVDFYVDGVLKGFATKYHRFVTPPYFACVYGADENAFDALENIDCGWINSLPDNLLPTIPHINWGPRPWLWPSFLSWPPPQPPQPYLANRVESQTIFPDKNNAMSLIINNFANHVYSGDDFSSFSQSSLNMEIDWVKVYQPFCCGVDKTIYTLTDLDNTSRNTGFLTGRILSIGTASGNGNFQQTTPAGPIWREVPSYFLATDEIRINNEAIFAPGVYTEMRITDCNGAMRMQDENMPGKNTGNSQNEYSIQENQDKAGLANNNGNNVSIEIYPVPATDEINLKCDDETFEKITSLCLIDVNGSRYEVNKDRIIHIENFNAGCYQLMITLKDNQLITKRIIKM